MNVVALVHDEVTVVVIEVVERAAMAVRGDPAQLALDRRAAAQLDHRLLTLLGQLAVGPAGLGAVRRDARDRRARDQAGGTADRDRHERAGILEHACELFARRHEEQHEVALTVVEDGAARTEDGVATVEAARASFASIGEAVEATSARVAEIAESITSIAAGSQKVDADVGEVASVAEQSSAAAQQVAASSSQTVASTRQIAESADELTRSAEELHRLAGRFVLA